MLWGMLRTILFFGSYWGTMLLATPFCTPFMLAGALGFKRFSRGVLGAIAHHWCRAVLWGTGARLEVTGSEHIPRSGRLVICPNHQGSLDIMLIVALMPRQVGFITKKQAAWLPLINLWAVAMGCIFIDRGNIAQGIKAIEQGIRKVADGRAMCIFPEGTRSRGDAMLPFKNGSFRLATRAGAAVLPVTIDGTWRIWEEHRRITPRTIRVVIHPPIQTAGMSTAEKKALPEQVRAVIAGALRQG
jgi:1-acyl-sn-glycerol-3-phosphate acyltransferase